MCRHVWLECSRHERIVGPQAGRPRLCACCCKLDSCPHRRARRQQEVQINARTQPSHSPMTRGTAVEPAVDPHLNMRGGRWTLQSRAIFVSHRYAVCVRCCIRTHCLHEEKQNVDPTTSISECKARIRQEVPTSVLLHSQHQQCDRRLLVAPRAASKRVGHTSTHSQLIHALPSLLLMPPASPDGYIAIAARSGSWDGSMTEGKPSKASGGKAGVQGAKAVDSGPFSEVSESNSLKDAVPPLRSGGSSKSILKPGGGLPSADSGKLARQVSWTDFEGKHLHTVREFTRR